MLSNHLHNGIETAKMAWSRLPNAEEGEHDAVGITKKSDEGSVESLDYEVIENYAYWEEQVPFLRFLQFDSEFVRARICDFCRFLTLVFDL